MIATFAGCAPVFGQNVFVADGATVLGDVTLGDGVSIWYGSVLRGDVNRISVGARSNIQDVSVVHVTTAKFETRVGADVTVGHRVVLHGCVIGDGVLIGMGAVLLDGVEVGAGCIIGAGALLTPGTKIPAGSLAFGAPARVVRPTTAEERREILASAQRYVQLAARHRTEVHPV